MPGDHSSLSVSTGTGIFLCVAGKMKLFAAAQKIRRYFQLGNAFIKMNYSLLRKKRYLASGKRFHLNLYRNCEEKMKNHENTSVYFEDS